MRSEVRIPVGLYEEAEPVSPRSEGTAAEGTIDPPSHIRVDQEKCCRLFSIIVAALDFPPANVQVSIDHRHDDDDLMMIQHCTESKLGLKLVLIRDITV